MALASKAAPMRIAQISPLTEAVPPETYGGTERVVSILTEELVRQGHDVTLYATGDSVTNARLVAMAPRAQRLDPESFDPLAPHVMMLERVRRDAEQYDILHFHLPHQHLPLVPFFGTPSVTTQHGRLDMPELEPLFALFPDAPMVAISNSQRQRLPDLNWVATIHHGIPADEITPSFRRGSYLAFLGRTSPEKRFDRAVEIARRSEMPLRVAAKMDEEALPDAQAEVDRLLEQPDVEFVGEIGGRDKAEFLAGAAAVLFPIDWPEPFGLVMVEAMAAGAPVIAFRHGSVPEVIDDGVSGLIVETTDEAIAAVPRALELPREGVRQAFERRFTAERMAHHYVEVYQQVIGKGR